jgi:predicted metal-dependent enzyme (double-stranded beta helix superfamily)
MCSADFAAFLNRLDDLIAPGSDPRETALAVRQAMADALKSDSFRLSCVERIMGELDRSIGQSRFPMVHRDREREYSVCVFYWPAGQIAPPHQHDYWTVTGVMLNGLRFRTFHVPPSQTAPVLEKQIDATVGDVGYICTTCVHDVANISEAVSLSLHVFNHPVGADGGTDDREFLLSRETPQSLSRTRATSDALYRDDVLSACAGLLARMPDPLASSMLDRIYDTGGAKARLAAVRAMCTLNPRRAAERAHDLADRVGGRLGENLRLISGKILEGRA